MMESIETIKDRSTYFAINKIIDLLSKTSVGQQTFHLLTSSALNRAKGLLRELTESEKAGNDMEDRVA